MEALDVAAWLFLLLLLLFLLLLLLKMTSFGCSSTFRLLATLSLVVYLLFWGAVLWTLYTSSDNPLGTNGFTGLILIFFLVFLVLIYYFPVLGLFLFFLLLILFLLGLSNL